MLIVFAGCRSEESQVRAGSVVTSSAGNVNVPVRQARLPDDQLHIAAKIPIEELDKDYRGSYRFSTNWFAKAVKLWRSTLAPYAGKPNLNYLEVGVYEGRSAFWIAENILTDASSRITVIDPFFDDTETRFRDNLAKYEHPEKFTVIRGFSAQELPKLAPNSFDIIYIDGSHSADDVLADAVMSFELLKVEGLMIFDDFAWNPALPPELRPMTAIDAFITSYRYRVKVLHRGSQLVLRKLAGPPCKDKRYCSQIGTHLYFWNTKSVVAIDGGKSVPVTKKQVNLIEAYLRSRREGADAETWLAEDIAHLRSDPAFVPLLNQLGAKLP